MDEYILKQATIDIYEFLKEINPSFDSLHIYCLEMDITRPQLNLILDFCASLQTQKKPINFSDFKKHIEAILNSELADSVVERLINCIKREGLLPRFPWETLLR